MKNNDYGYFGKDTEGYIHYKKTFDRTQEKQLPKATPNKPAGQKGNDKQRNKRRSKSLLKLCAAITAVVVPLLLWATIFIGYEEGAADLVKIGVIWVVLGVLYGIS